MDKKEDDRKDPNLRWLRAHGFRKERGRDEWCFRVTDAVEKYKAPTFTVQAIRGPNGLWHARVLVDKTSGAQEINFIMLSGNLVKEGVPEGWEEPFSVILGNCLCADSAANAVGTAARRATCFIHTTCSGKWYNVRSLEADMLGDGK